MDETRIRALVAELDALVPCEGARARLDVYGGAPDESCVIGNQAGALRLGIEVLRGTLAAMDDGATGRRPVGLIDLEEVLDDESAFLIDHVELADPLPPPNRARVTDLDAPLPPSMTLVFAAGAVIGLIVGLFLG